MTPEAPLPTTPPFLSFYTPTYRRPAQLARCLHSVGEQTARHDLDQIVVPDHVRYGVGPGLYGRLSRYAPLLTGRYVHLLCDDDVLASETVVEQVRTFARKRDDPPMIVTRVIKGALHLPAFPDRPPAEGEIDLGSYIIRQDIFQQHVRDFTPRYAGDFDFVHAVYRAGHPFAFCDLLFLTGGHSNGRPEY